MATSLSPTLLASSPSLSSSTGLVSLPQHTKFHFHRCDSLLGICKFSAWSGLRNLGIPTSRITIKIGSKGKCKRKGVYASLFGVGAPEALVIGVVALLVFGPKGLAEVARNIGKTLRSFQPTIRELQEVSREFKTTLEREIGLDEVQEITRPTPTRPTPPPPSTSVSEDSQTMNPAGDSSSSGKAYTTEEYLKITEEQLKKQKEMQSGESDADPQGQSQGNSPSSSAATTTEENATSSKEQLDASAVLQEKEKISAESPVEPQAEKQGGSPALSEEETQEYLKKLEAEVQAAISEKQKKAASAASEVKSEVSDSQEAGSVASSEESESAA